MPTVAKQELPATGRDSSDEPASKKAKPASNVNDDDMDDDAEAAALDVEDLDEDPENAEENAEKREKRKKEGTLSYKNGGIDLDAIKKSLSNLETNCLEENSRIKNSSGKVAAKPHNTVFYMIIQAKQLKKVASVFNQLCDKVQFRIFKDSIRIVGEDKKRGAIVEFTKRKFGFLHCELDDAILGVTLQDLFKISSLYSDSDNIVMYLEKEEDDMVKIHGYNSGKRNNEFGVVALRLDGEQPNKIGFANVDYETDASFAHIEMEATELHDTFRDFSNLSGEQVKVNYSAKDKTLIVGTDNGDSDSTELVSGDSTFKEGDNVKFKRPGRNTKFNMNADMMARLSAAAKPFSDSGYADLYVKNNFPFIATYKSIGQEHEKKGTGFDVFAFYMFHTVQ